MNLKKISPSMMCVPILETEKYLKVFKEEGVEYLHIDIMDGSYVPNITLGTDYVKELKTISDIPLDVHLMVYRPEEKIDWFGFGEGDLVTAHVESTPHIVRALNKIKDTGAKAMVSLNPGTDIRALEYLLDYIDGVVVMTVNPGFAGQKALASAIRKIADVRKYLDDRGYEHLEIEVDGNVSFNLAGEMSKNSANIFVAGSSSFLNEKVDLREGIQKFRDIINLK